MLRSAVPFILAISLIWLLLTAGASQSAARNIQLGVGGADNREMVEDTKYPWGAIGRVNNAGHGFCTGVLIGERQVLTAAHCLRSRSGRGGMSQPSEIHFLAGYNRGSYLAHSRAVSIRRSWTHGIREETADDWAILHLDQPIGKQVGFLPLENFGPKAWRTDGAHGQHYMQAGYSQDRAHILTRDRSCDIKGFLAGQRTFAHQCDATNGDSGSPIMVRRGSRYAIVGLHVASARDKSYGVAIAGAQILPQLSALAHLPSLAQLPSPAHLPGQSGLPARISRQ